MQEVFVNVRGSLIQNGHEDTTEYFTVGKIKNEGDKKILTYNNAVNGEEELTEIQIEGNSVLMKRVDSEPTPIVIYLEKHKLFSSLYNTRIGPIDVEVFPTMVNIKDEDNEGEIDLEYITTIKDTQSLNKLKVTYMKQ